MIKIALFTFITTTSLFAQNDIEIYNCYGNSHKVIVEGRLLHKKTQSIASKDDNLFQNLWRKTGQLINNEIKNENLSLTLDDKIYKTISDDEGYFSFTLDSNKTLKQEYKPLKVQINKNNFSICKTPIIETKKEYLGIISDFDDTIVVSNVTNKIKLALNLLFKNYKQRDTVADMSETFNLIISNNPPKTPSTLFFITGSPNQLSSSIKEYLTLHNYPKATLITKKIHGDNPDALFDQFKYKTKKIEKLIKLYPNIKWYFFGDSGEKDREVYTCIARHFPEKVKAILIRNVKTGKFEKLPLSTLYAH